MAKGLLSLPDELLLQIGKLLSINTRSDQIYHDDGPAQSKYDRQSQRDLYNLCLTCRRLKPITWEFLYQHVTISHYDTTPLLLRTFFEQPYLRTYVKSLVVWVKTLLYNENTDWKDPLQGLFKNDCDFPFRDLVVRVSRAAESPRAPKNLSSLMLTKYIPDYHFVLLLCLVGNIASLNIIRQGTMRTYGYALGSTLCRLVKDKSSNEELLPKLHTLECNHGIRPFGGALLITGLRSLQMIRDDGFWTTDIPVLSTLSLVNVSLTESTAKVISLHELCHSCPRLERLEVELSQWARHSPARALPFTVDQALLICQNSLTKLQLFLHGRDDWMSRLHDPDVDEEPFHPLQCLPQLTKLRELSVDLRVLMTHPEEAGERVLEDCLPSSLERLDIVFETDDMQHLRHLEPLFVGTLGAGATRLSNLQEINIWRQSRHRFGERICEQQIRRAARMIVVTTFPSIRSKL
ncbi:hypothetical protein F5B20DRAFT_589282 [Whalleya microplaca]|nr:hypothetical protein F5B20DRAFT_589282 [Whalleya microplaca]